MDLRYKSVSSIATGVFALEVLRKERYFPVRKQIGFLKACELDPKGEAVQAEEQPDQRNGEEKAASVFGESRNPVWLWSEVPGRR